MTQKTVKRSDKPEKNQPKRSLVLTYLFSFTSHYVNDFQLTDSILSRSQDKSSFSWRQFILLNNDWGILKFRSRDHDSFFFWFRSCAWTIEYISEFLFKKFLLFFRYLLNECRWLDLPRIKCEQITRFQSFRVEWLWNFPLSSFMLLRKQSFLFLFLLRSLNID